jgi:hypothetical protein
MESETKKQLWIRELSCGHERPTNLFFIAKNYEKPKVGDFCFCRECCETAKIIRVKKADKESIKELKDIMKMSK